MTDAERITRALRGRWHGRYGVACCPVHGDKRPSLSLADGEGGRLLARCHAGCRFEEVLDALRGMGLIDGKGVYTPPSPADLVRIEAAEKAEAEKRERQALAVWREGQHITGTIAETYLRGRGITCDLPETLRFHPDCWHPNARRFPALLARVDGTARFALHRTYLRPDGRGKADAEPAKAMLGGTAGGAVRLTETDGPLVVCEGIETGLSLASGLLQRPARIWAALSTSGVGGLRLPDHPHRLTIATDGDDPGKAAGQKLAQRAAALGWQVSILPAPEGNDWNDILMKKGAAA